MDPNTTPSVPSSPQQPPSGDGSQQLFPTPVLPSDQLYPAGSPAPKSKFKMFLIVGVVLLVLLIGGLIIAALSSKSGNNTQNSSEFNPNSNLVVTTQEFLGYLQADKFGDAIKMIKPVDSQSQQQIADRMAAINYVKLHYPLNECQTEGSTANDLVIIYNCKNSDNKEIIMQFTAVQTDGKTVLSDFSILDEKSNS